MACDLHQLQGRPMNAVQALGLDEFGTAPLFTDPLAPAVHSASPEPPLGGPGTVRFREAASQISTSQHATNGRKNS